MSFNIELKPSELKTDYDLNVHLMPCKINHQGPANVDHFFSPYQSSNNDISTNIKSMQASFRGVPLQGEKITIPDGYKGIILEETTKPLTDKEDKSVISSKSFSDFTYWNWDMVPTSNDPIHPVMDSWISISQTVI